MPPQQSLNNLSIIKPDPRLREILVNFLCDWTRLAFDSHDRSAFQTRFKKFKQEIIDEGYDWEDIQPYLIALISTQNETISVVRRAIRGLPLDTRIVALKR